MPEQHNPGRPVASDVADLQAATSNQTVQHFLGGKKRSWMQNASFVKPTPRPPKPQEPAQQPRPPSRPLPREIPVPQQDVPPSQLAADVYTPKTGPRQDVLPSPAPTDEPSPAVSITQDSPNPVTTPLPELRPQPLGNNFQHAIATAGPNRSAMLTTADNDQVPLPVTEARFILGPSPEAGVHTTVTTSAPTHNNTQTHSEDAEQMSGGAGDSPGRVGEQTDRQIPSVPDHRPGQEAGDQAVFSPGGLPSPGLAFAFPSMRLPSYAAAQLETASNDSAPKRRRTDKSSYVCFASQFWTLTLTFPQGRLLTSPTVRP